MEEECYASAEYGSYFRFINEEYKKCVTDAECYATLDDGSYFTYSNVCISTCPHGFERVSKEEGNCRPCGNECVVYCAGMKVNSMSSAQKLSGCTHVNGTLEIRINRPETVPELTHHLGSIRFIQKDLKIARSNAFTSLNFLPSLHTINGTNLDRGGYTLFVYENQNLKRLWNFTELNLTIANGPVAFHNNPLLCLSEIDTLVNVTGVKNVSISTYSNGNEALCDTTAVEINVQPNCTNATVTWEKPLLEGNETVVGYIIFYTQYFKKTFDKLDSNTVCDRNIWESSDSWESTFVGNNSYFISSLEPYTEYACYVKTMTNVRSTQSNITHFKTLPGDPTEIPSFEANSTSHDSINLTWSPPWKLNGKFAFYSISIDLIEDDPEFIFQRDYCLHPLDFSPPPATTTNITEGKCCQNIVKARVGLFTHGVIAFCYVQRHKMQSWNNRMCYRTLYQTETNSPPDDFAILNLVVSTPNKLPDVHITDPDTISHEITGLKHFSVYAFYITACNVNITARAQCSPVVSAYARTLKLDHADNVMNVTVQKIVGYSIQLTWSGPTNPNGLVVAYHIEYKRSDVVHSQSVVDCVTTNDFLHNDSVYTIHTLMPGKYIVRVQAISLASKGRHSPYLAFELVDESLMYQWLPIVATVLLIMAAITGIICYFWYKTKLRLHNIYLIASVNPDYTGGVYVRDEWEIDQNDIEIGDREIGRGTFGTVYTGIIKSRNMPCAIKTLNGDSQTMRMEFLHEASIMKNFSDTYHIVKLLGLVSETQPPLVVMELMERGDLKAYLRRARHSSSDNITSTETYKMAAEIADGMAYLSAKKYVHRDLAARNCMVAADRTVKVGDFGMTRDIYETDYYRKGTKGLLPVRWMAPESLADGVFTNDSDVWSYGVVLWEIATFAEQPYPGFSNEQVLNHVIGRGRLQRPDECSDLLYEIMATCWKWRPIDRPQFIDIVHILTPLIGETFQLISYCHTQAAKTHRLNAGERAVNQPALGLAASEASENSYQAFGDNVDLYFGEDSLLPHENQRRYRPNIVPSSSSPRPYLPSSLGGY